ncbi:hypothetical protein ABB37_04432 [Leptomonas pyrrhocoris]|uniref:Uncharacterized protein n=1 Tax=Leptomonas pyrrhocoris TaxID=157538 RepID=A0A0N0VFI4_LEPPY|nr:hypothetical protein ABB37_04432 [Leptomonas pyrrhocoris]KPA81071.1 hypothetical protein ABB37_04432 [Leptomonas pyrrhocoris]|eukprot:XP_015659510.1 hypothetical protein ABB37_04432 [Leptomonas pyrrhocoris]
MGRFHSADSSNGSSNNTGVAADSTRFGESSRSTTPRPLSPSATSTPRLSTPLMAPLSEEVYAVKPWAMMEAAAVATSARSTASFPLSGTTSAADALAADQMRIPPACVELPGPQSLFIRGTAASGCDSHSIGLLQRSVLAEQLAASLSRSQ